jgi:hypothetical protein
LLDVADDEYRWLYFGQGNRKEPIGSQYPRRTIIVKNVLNRLSEKSGSRDLGVNNKKSEPSSGFQLGFPVVKASELPISIDQERIPPLPVGKK